MPHLLDRFDELRATPEGRTYVLGEYQLNALGYELLGRDSLDEALVTAGHLDEAIEAYRRSVELNPSNRSGQTMLRRLARGESGAATGTN